MATGEWLTVEITPKKGYLTVIWSVLARPNRAIRLQHLRSANSAWSALAIRGETSMAIRVGINGFGRIGRNVLRAIAESGRKDIEAVGITDTRLVGPHAHLPRQGQGPGPPCPRRQALACLGTGRRGRCHHRLRRQSRRADQGTSGR